jgi:hypothetical protein
VGENILSKGIQLEKLMKYQEEYKVAGKPDLESFQLCL